MQFCCLVLNFPSVDPFNEFGKSDQEGLIHIRIQQRNGRKTLTTVQGIADKYDKKKLVKYCKKVRISVKLCQNFKVF